MATNSNGDSSSNKKNRPIYLNWRLWFAMTTLFLLLSGGALFIFGEEAMTAVMVAGVAWISSGGAWAFVGKILTPLWDEIKKSKELAATAKKEVGMTAATLIQINHKTDENSERSALLERRYEALSRVYATLTDNLQEQQDKSDAKIARLETQLAATVQQLSDRQIELFGLKEVYRREIGELKEDHRREMQDYKAQVKELSLENGELRKRVTDLELEMKEVKIENGHLHDENKLLKKLTFDNKKKGETNP